MKPLLGALGLAMLALTGCAVGNSTGWSVPKRSLADQVALLGAHIDFRTPAGLTEPVPAVLMLHGCGGLRQVQEDYAAAALEAGYGVVIIASNQARGIGRFAAMSQVCLALRLWGQERAADVHAAIALADDHPLIDADNLALIGWSHGGWTLLDALGFSGASESPLSLLAPGIEDLSRHVRAAILVYPYCGFPMRTDGADLDARIPVHAILAERDMIAPPDHCVSLFNRAVTAGVAVDLEIWPGVTHAFDEPHQPPDPRMEYDPDAAQRARARMIDILDSRLSR